jgi:hypothetical protein
MKPIVFASTSAPCRIEVAGIPCVMSMIGALGRDALDDAVAGADEVVLQPEVAQKRDEHAAERNAGPGTGLPTTRRAGGAATLRGRSRLAAQS